MAVHFQSAAGARALAEAAYFRAFGYLPQNHFSRGIGRLVRGLPYGVAQVVIRGLVARYRIDVNEAEKPLKDYQTVEEFFTRRLKRDARAIDVSDDVAVSPVDGRIIAHGGIDDHTALQAKGMAYTIPELLHSDIDAEHYRHGTFVTHYLAPRDYHRIHSPLSGIIDHVVYVPGQLFPVNGPSVRNVEKLFTRNERLIVHLRTRAGWVAVVMVGATNVGEISLAFQDFATNQPGLRPGIVPLGAPPGGAHLETIKGGELGCFHLGSTVILLFARGAATLLPEVNAGAWLPMGRAIARLHADATLKAGG